MDKTSVETAILSVSTPGVHLGDDALARAWARRVNEYAAEIARRLPDRFGFFATLCLPDVEGSLAELAYAFDALRADGVVLLANSRGVYLGDPRQDALWAELERRRAVVFVHPSVLPGSEPLPGLPPFVADFLLDTTRAAIRLAASGTLDRFSNVRVILSHAGGFVPYAAYRIALAASPKGDPADGLAQLRKLYFDVALSGSPTALPSLLAFAAPGHVTFGSDFPYAPPAAVAAFTGGYERYAIDAARRASIDRGAAEELFPRLRTR
jgi:predicted TIM-barrel fold metal-dependent hydrolase